MIDCAQVAPDARTSLPARAFEGLFPRLACSVVSNLPFSLSFFIIFKRMAIQSSCYSHFSFFLLFSGRSSPGRRSRLLVGGREDITQTLMSCCCLLVFVLFLLSLSLGIAANVECYVNMCLLGERETYSVIPLCKLLVCLCLHPMCWCSLHLWHRHMMV